MSNQDQKQQNQVEPNNGGQQGGHDQKPGQQNQGNEKPGQAGQQGGNTTPANQK